jgi:hypothetical protein
MIKKNSFRVDSITLPSDLATAFQMMTLSDMWRYYCKYISISYPFRDYYFSVTIPSTASHLSDES